MAWKEIVVKDGRSEKRYEIPDGLEYEARGDGWTARIAVSRVPDKDGRSRVAGFDRIEFEFDPPMEARDLARFKWAQLIADAAAAGGRRPENFQVQRRRQ